MDGLARHSGKTLVASLEGLDMEPTGEASSGQSKEHLEEGSGGKHQGAGNRTAKERREVQDWRHWCTVIKDLWTRRSEGPQVSQLVSWL